MKIGVSLRNMGPQSTPSTIAECARLAEEAGLADVWVTDHLAIPPDDSEGSGGRYLDPLVTLAWIAGCTERIGIGTAVINLPYRPALPTAKQIATLQELSGERLRLGVGVGWMRAEFQALGVDRSRRGALTDEALELLHRAFAADVVEEHGQPFLFLPRPQRPPIFVGGNGEAARRRAVRFGDAWLPMVGDLEALRADLADLQRIAAAAERRPPAAAALHALPLDDPQKSADRAHELAAMGVEHLVCGLRYDGVDEFSRRIDTLAGIGGS